MTIPQDPAHGAATAGDESTGITRRTFVRGSAVLAAAAAAAAFGAGGVLGAPSAKASPGATQGLPPFVPGTPLAADQLRISFMGTSFLPRIAQQCNSVYVELGNGDSFVFDYGSGVSSKYVAMGIPYSKQTRVFLTHLHGDHMGDLVTLYCFGPPPTARRRCTSAVPAATAATRAPRPSASTSTRSPGGTASPSASSPPGSRGRATATTSFRTSSPTCGPASPTRAHGVVISHFPAIRDRDGSISCKLEWNGLSMVFSGDTKPSDYMLRHAKGVDVLVHEMVVPASVWATKNSGLQPGDEGYLTALKMAKTVQRSSHTPEVALGYILEKTQPRLGVATHFQANDDTIGPATHEVRRWYAGPFAIAVDGFVVTVSKDAMSSACADLDQYAWYPKPKMHDPSTLKDPRYPGPLAQLNRRLLKHVIPPSEFNQPPSGS